MYSPQREGAWRCGEEGWGEGPQPRSGPQRQQHLFRGWIAKRLAFLQQQGQWGGMRRRCHNQMQASWPSPRKGRHLLHLPKALFSKPQRTKWLRRRARGGENWPWEADPHVSAGNPRCKRCQHRWSRVGQHSTCSKQSSEATTCSRKKLGMPEDRC